MIFIACFYSIIFLITTNVLSISSHNLSFSSSPLLGGAVAQMVEHATSGEDVPGSIPTMAARFLLVGSVSV